MKFLMELGSQAGEKGKVASNTTNATEITQQANNSTGEWSNITPQP